MGHIARGASVALLLLVAVSATAQEAPVNAPTETATFSAGKYLHVIAGIAVGMGAAGAAEWLTPGASLQSQPITLSLVALGAATAAGIAKELLDLTGFGDPRLADILITASGGLVAAGAVFYDQSVFPATADGRNNALLFLFVTAAVLSVPVIDGFVKEITYAVNRHSAARK